jgi:hypothetical protein
MAHETDANVPLRQPAGFKSAQVNAESTGEWLAGPIFQLLVADR